MQRKKKTHLLRDMKWVNGVFTMPFWWLIEILFTATLHFISIEIPDYTQINDELYTFSRTFLAKEPIHNLTLEIYGSFPICVLSLLLLLLQIICQIATGLLRHCHWTSFFKKHRYNIYMFNVLIRNNEQFD